jgi:hypothetical protein
MKRREPAWVRKSDEQLLDLRLCDLKLTLRGSPLQACLVQLHGELAARGIRFRPHAWLAEDWFSPDGVPGFAMPFYLAHPRLQRLERRMTGEAEGGSAAWRMRIVRHEAGHAIDNAFRLRRRARWRALFGRASQRYPREYRARPASRRHVQHLGDWYAQSHPAEDFAETFAVWLQPRSGWRRRYADWPARAKLEYVDGLAGEFALARPPVRSRDRIEPLAENTRTLRQHYRAKIAARRSRALADALLRRAARVPAAQQGRREQALAPLLRARKVALRAWLERESGANRYTTWQILRLAIERCERLGLVAQASQRVLLPRLRAMLLRATQLYLASGQLRVKL